MKQFKLPQKAVQCGSELRRLTAREMIGAFLSSRGRHHTDIRKPNLADLDYSLSRHLFPNHRRTHMRAVATLVRHGNSLFEPDEVGHMNSLFEDLAPTIAPEIYAQRHKLFARRSSVLGVRYENPLSQHYPETVVASGRFSAKPIKA
jgi:hypothetical protein